MRDAGLLKVAYASWPELNQLNNKPIVALVVGQARYQEHIKAHKDKLMKQMKKVLMLLMKQKKRRLNNPRKSEAANGKAVEGLKETLETVACAPAVNMYDELSRGPDSE